MKSQKIRNRPPRPFKNNQGGGGWSSGNFIPQSQAPVKKAKPLPKKEAEKDNEKDAEAGAETPAPEEPGQEGK